jgi:hypothetical protein
MKIVILTGPLGSGKTTTLPFVFDELEGNKLLVINDVGKTPVDARRLKDVGEIETMPAGCIACTGLPSLRRIVGSAQSRSFDYLIIEPTGVVDGDEMLSAVREFGLSYACLCLVDAGTLEEDLADGVLPSQLRLATQIGVTHLQRDQDFESVLIRLGEYIGELEALALPDPKENKFPRLNLEFKNPDGPQCGKTTRKENLGAHGFFSESFSLKPCVPVTDLEEELMRFSFRRAKGTVSTSDGVKEFDLVAGRFTLGHRSDSNPHVVVISKKTSDVVSFADSPLVIPREFKVTSRPKALREEHPIEITQRSIERWINRFPSILKGNGELRVRCEAFMVLQLALRKNVPVPTKRKAIWTYTKWLIDSAVALDEVKSKFSSHVTGGWSFLIGKFLSRILVEEKSPLETEEVDAIIRIDPLKLIIKGLDDLTNESKGDPNLWIDVEEWPKKNGLNLTLGLLPHSSMSKAEVLRVYKKTLALLEKHGAEWQTMLDNL